MNFGLERHTTMATSQEQSAADSPKPAFTISSSHEGFISCVAWLPGDQIVTGSYDKTVRIWNLTDGTQEGISMIHDHEVQEIVATKDGRIVSCCPRDKHLIVWNADTQELVERPRSNPDYGLPEMITLSENEELLASYHLSGVIFWEIAGTMRVRSRIRIDEEGNVSAARFSPNGSRLALSCDGRLSVFDVETGKRIFRSPNAGLYSYNISWSLDGHRVFCGNEKGQIRCFSSNTGGSVGAGEPWTGHTKAVRCTSLSPDGKWLATGSFDGIVRFWDTEAGKPVGEPLPHQTYVTVYKMAFSRSGEFLASICIPFRTGTKTSPIFVWRLPWWDDRNQKTPNVLLDTSAVVPTGTSGPSNIPNLGLLDAFSPRHPHPPRTRSRENLSSGTPRVQNSVRSWGWWKRIPRFGLLRSYSIYTGHAPPRTAVASSSTVDNNQRSHSRTTPPASGHSSSEENSEDSSDTPSAGLEPEVGEAGCCGLWSRRRNRETAVPVAIEPSSHTTHPANSNDASIPVPQSTHTATQAILDLPVVVRSTDTPRRPASV